MEDKYLKFVNSGLGKSISKNLGLPQPVSLQRFVDREFAEGKFIVSSAENSLFEDKVRDILTKSGVTVVNTVADNEKLKGICFDASGIKSSDELIQLHTFFKPLLKKMGSNSRILIIGLIPEKCENPKLQTAQRALIGFVKALGKELLKGGIANLVYADKDAVNSIESSVRFFLSTKSTYVSGQFANVESANSISPESWLKPLAGKVVLVTGAARGIGRAIAETIARDGATVVGLDIPQAKEDLENVAKEIGGEALMLDITSESAPKEIATYFKEKHGGLDVIIHNAGVTRDKLLANMQDQLWTMTIDINLSSEERINDELLAQNVINSGGRIICVSSISGISGNRGQVNYATSKAGVIGMVDSMKNILREKNITINAVAPGFIETKMTAAIPFTIREAGRRLNALAQGGQPVDVAETIAWYANPASQGVTGNVVRVCGLALIGA